MTEILKIISGKRFLLWAGVTVFLLAAIFYFWRGRGSLEKEFAAPRPSEAVLTDKNLVLKAKIVSALPFGNENYKIEYLPRADTFLLFIKTNPFEANKKQALEWFKKYGVSDAEKEFKIVVGSERGVY